MSATAAGLPTVNFALTNMAGIPRKMSTNAGTTPQSAKVTTVFAVPLAVTVSDIYNNPVSGVVVTFTAPAWGASGTFANGTATTQATTNSSGIAAATAFTANNRPGEPYEVRATATGLPTVSFTLTNLWMHVHRP